MSDAPQQMPKSDRTAGGAFAPSNCSPAEWALRIIRFSSLADFESAVEWGQWCRSVAAAALVEDEEMLERLEREMAKQENGALCNPAESEGGAHGKQSNTP